MKFSVLINNYNYAKFLPETLASVAAQSLAAHEIIVVDDGSSDDSLAVLQNLSKKIPGLRVHAQTNGGQLSAMRAGVRLATGDWCVFLDADDTWEPHHLKNAAEAISRNKDIGLYYSNHLESSGPPLYRSKWPQGTIGPCAGLVAAKGMRIGTITSALFLRKDLAFSAIDLDESFDKEWITRADDCLVFGAALAGAIIHYNSTQSVNYRIHGGNAFAEKTQDPYTAYQYEMRKRRLIAQYCARNGIRMEKLLKLLLCEYETFDRNRKHRFVRSRYLQAIKKANAPLPSKIAAFYKIITTNIFQRSTEKTP